MCGIFCIHFFEKSRLVNVAMVEKATNSMAHRGPDDSGYYINGNTGLGHRRLSIIDLASGHQPMTNEDGNVVVVFNGEIYNFKEIQTDLLARGHCFHTDCDTEVIVHAYEEWGTECLKKFNGMFAFVVFDKKRQRLWIVRDRLGIKPLYYFYDKEVFICASEVKAILKTGFVKSVMNENVLDAFFSVGYVPGYQTMFKGISKVLPGHYLIIDNGDISQCEYWDFADIEQKNVEQATFFAEIESLLLDCVEKRLVSDVPVGAFASGGLDSSVVVGMMDKLIAPRSVNTFTVAYNQGYSEKEYAQIVSDKYRTNHHVFYLEPDNFFVSLETLIRFAEEPIVEPAAIALYHISKRAREHAIVLLSGEGSDEIFGGYYLYQFMCVLDKVRRYCPDTVLRIMPFLVPVCSKLKYQKYLDWMNTPLHERYQGTSSYMTPALKRYLYHPDFIKNQSTYLPDQFAGHFNKVKGKDPLSQMLYVDTKTWLVDDLLVKADKMTMAASIELRVPFLDYRFVEAVTSLPTQMKIRKGESKYLLKKISESFLPKEITYREKKGFPVPTNEWFQGSLMPQIEDRLSQLKKDGWFRPQALDDMLVRQKSGKEDLSKMLMTLLVFSEWLRQYG
ncbi:asparagine synthase (glutamine-hydrolyzing) [Desulfatiferula olefinivorans]